MKLDTKNCQQAWTCWEWSVCQRITWSMTIIESERRNSLGMVKSHWRSKIPIYLSFRSDLHNFIDILFLIPFSFPSLLPRWNTLTWSMQYMKLSNLFLGITYHVLAMCSCVVWYCVFKCLRCDTLGDFFLSVKNLSWGTELSSTCVGGC